MEQGLPSALGSQPTACCPLQLQHPLAGGKLRHRADPPCCHPTAARALGAPCSPGEGEGCLAQHSPPSLC